MNNLPEVFRSNHFWGIWRKKPTEMIKIYVGKVNPCLLVVKLQSIGYNVYIYIFIYIYAFYSDNIHIRS